MSNEPNPAKWLVNQSDVWWTASANTRLVWMGMKIISNEDGECTTSPKTIGIYSGVSTEDAEKGIKELLTGWSKTEPDGSERFYQPCVKLIEDGKRCYLMLDHMEWPEIARKRKKADYQRNRNAELKAKKNF